ncbi:MAG TPA: chemotaxis protein CheW [Nostocaceae cyanobacterium]|nr:chemotaxis protein CheW [Nostocaceae cyanobacterium]
MNQILDVCWQKIGIYGDRTCPELSNVAHCRNCSIYTGAGRQLLNRPLPNDYRQKWTQLIAQPRTKTIQPKSLAITAKTTTLKVVIFRLQQEWLALPAEIFQETTTVCPIHTLPHRSNQILRGLVNIRGELYLCISLSHLLNLEISGKSSPSFSPVVYSRMVVVKYEGDIWVFSVDEIYGLHQIQQEELIDPPTNLTSANRTYTKSLFSWHSYSVSYLDTESLFSTLARKVTP